MNETQKIKAIKKRRREISEEKAKIAYESNLQHRSEEDSQEKLKKKEISDIKESLGLI
jgi:hypothetical protein